MNFNLGDIVCFKDPTVPGGGRPLVVTFLAENSFTVRIIRQGLALAYSTTAADLHLLLPSPLGKVLRVKFEDSDWQAYENAHHKAVIVMKELGLVRA